MKAINFRSVLVAVAAAGTIFQIGHFIEHLTQFAVWVGGNHTVPYMSPVARWLSHKIGAYVVPSPGEMCPSQMASPRQMLMGMEILHLIGNIIFLSTIACLNRLMPSKLVRNALYVEGFHLYEHIMLTLSALFLNQSVGMSTIFGGAQALGGLEFAVGYRVTWHFVMNLVPTAMMAVAMARRCRRLPEKMPALAVA